MLVLRAILWGPATAIPVVMDEFSLKVKGVRVTQNWFICTPWASTARPRGAIR